MKEKISEALKKMSLHAVKVSCNTASFNFSGQPKEPESLKKYISNRRSHRARNACSSKR